MKPTAPALLVLIAIACAGLAGCGQKGDLYLPGHNPNPPQPLVQQVGPSDDAGSDRPDQNPAEDRNDNRSSPAD
ncbi:lipoprotein [Salinisphaera sp. SPP-AMP-43]|uniref:LPS translocon maturation chaperone LptM n=1 Tax=Salinisphaera sp. SPP-AMP-43 TaxID=3121288 RepID=UPI003C6DDE03